MKMIETTNQAQESQDRDHVLGILNSCERDIEVWDLQNISNIQHLITFKRNQYNTFASA